MKLKVSASFTGVIPTSEYANARPGYAAEIEVDLASQDFKLDMVGDFQKQLQDVCLGRFKEDERRLTVERIQKEQENFRFYDGFPSVTSIIGWDSDFGGIPPQELRQYASQGNLYHAQVAHFIKAGKWEDVSKIEGTYSDLVIVEKGSLRLPYDDWDFPAFLKKYPLEKMEEGKPVISRKHEFGGTPDIRVCWLDGKKTLADVKRTPDKFRHFKQTAGYVIAEEENGEAPYEQMILIPASGKTEQGFSKPALTTEIGQYKAAFLKDREYFRKRFGI